MCTCTTWHSQLAAATLITVGSGIATVQQLLTSIIQGLLQELLCVQDCKSYVHALLLYAADYMVMTRLYVHISRSADQLLQHTQKQWPQFDP
jgi:hypothetical protein